VLVSTLEGVKRHHISVLVAEDHIPGPNISTGLGGRRDDGARGLLVFSLEVLTDHPVFLNGAPGERIPLARVLACDAAARQVVLEARAVNEDVDRVRALTAGRKGARHAVDPVLSDRDAGSQRREVE